MRISKLQNRHAAFAVGLIVSAAIAAPTLGQAVECGGDVGSKYNGKTVLSTGDAVLFKSKVLNVDADGAPNSYRVDGNGLSYSCDGVTAVGSTPDNDPKGWQAKCWAAWKKANDTHDYSGVRIFGFLTGPKNVPEIQKAGDPLPGDAYITTTSVAIPGTPDRTQRHWVDATEIPYIVLSSAFTAKFGVKDAGIAVVYRPKTDKFAFAVYGDGGKLGEASVRLHQDIGSKPVVKIKGTDRAKATIDDVTLTVVFPGKVTTPTTDSAKWRAEIDATGKKALQDWGGVDRLKACAQ
jgi:hypothetical protein